MKKAFIKNPLSVRGLDRMFSTPVERFPIQLSLVSKSSVSLALELPGKEFPPSVTGGERLWGVAAF